MGQPEEILVRRGEVINGPLTAKQVRKLVARGRLSPTDSVSVAAGPWVGVADYLRTLPSVARHVEESPAVQPERSGAGQWYYMLSGIRHGPVSVKELKELARTGQLQPGDSVRKKGIKGWRRAAKARGLFVVESVEPERPRQVAEEIPENVPIELPSTVAKPMRRTKRRPKSVAKPKSMAPRIIGGLFAVCAISVCAVLSGLIGTRPGLLGGSSGTYIVTQDVGLYLYPLGDFDRNSTLMEELFFQHTGVPIVGTRENTAKPGQVWFDEKAILLTSNTTIDVLKTDFLKTTTGDVPTLDEVHFVRVCNGRHKGKEGWLTDKYIRVNR